MYSILKPDQKEILKAKRISKTVVKKFLRHKMYRKCLDNRDQMTHPQVALRSHKHQIGLYEQQKISLSPMDIRNIAVH